MLNLISVHVFCVNKNVNFFTGNVYGKVYFWPFVNLNVNFFARKVYEKVYGADSCIKGVI